MATITKWWKDGDDLDAIQIGAGLGANFSPREIDTEFPRIDEGIDVVSLDEYLEAYQAEKMLREAESETQQKLQESAGEVGSTNESKDRN